MVLGGLDHAFGCIAAVHVRDNEFEGYLQFFFNLKYVGGAAFVV